MMLNEPESSRHPDLHDSPSRLIGSAAGRSQIIVVTHAATLISALKEQRGCHCITLEKSFGETSVAGLRPVDRIPWNWPSR